VEQKIHATDELIQQHIDSLNTSSIDKFPVFKDCEQLDENLEAEKNCFITSLSIYISNCLLGNKLVLANELDVSFRVVIQVSETGKVTIISQKIDEILVENIPNIDQIIEQCISELPEIGQAYKKINSEVLVPVKTRFVIPIRVIAKASDN